MSQQATEKVAKSDYAIAVNRIAAALAGELAAGDVAELRRLQHDDPWRPALFKAMLRYVEPSVSLAGDGPEREEAERRWAVVLAAMAEVRHRPGARLGAELAAIGYSELRLARLLRDQGPTLGDALRTAAHQLRAHGCQVDWTDGARLMLSAGRSWGDAVRRSIARDFYRAATPAANAAGDGPSTDTTSSTEMNSSTEKEKS